MNETNVIKQLLDNPNNKELLGVYADYLEELGDLQQANFYRNCIVLDDRDCRKLSLDRHAYSTFITTKTNQLKKYNFKLTIEYEPNKIVTKEDAGKVFNILLILTNIVGHWKYQDYLLNKVEEVIRVPSETLLKNRKPYEVANIQVYHKATFLGP